MDLKSLVSQKDTMNLEIAEKRLILKAIIKSNFRTKIAFRLNCEGTYISYNCYLKRFRKNFPMGVKDLKTLCIEQFNLKEDINGNFKVNK
jgi:hypothetical protein